MVDEVAKLRKNREERRAGQKAERERRNQYYEPGNPNWEFAIMVKEFRYYDSFTMFFLSLVKVGYCHDISYGCMYVFHIHVELTGGHILGRISAKLGMSV